VLDLNYISFSNPNPIILTRAATRGGQPLLYKKRRYRSLLNSIAALPQSFLNKNSSKLALPLFATAPFAAL